MGSKGLIESMDVILSTLSACTFNLTRYPQFPDLRCLCGKCHVRLLYRQSSLVLVFHLRPLGLQWSKRREAKSFLEGETANSPRKVMMCRDGVREEDTGRGRGWCVSCQRQGDYPAKAEGVMMSGQISKHPWGLDILYMSIGSG